MMMAEDWYADSAKKRLRDDDGEAGATGPSSSSRHRTFHEQLADGAGDAWLRDCSPPAF